MPTYRESMLALEAIKHLFAATAAPFEVTPAASGGYRDLASS